MKGLGKNHLSNQMWIHNFTSFIIQCLNIKPWWRSQQTQALYPQTYTIGGHCFFATQA